MVFEWPRYCTYWKWPEVEQFLRDNKMQKADFNGCRFGLRSIVKGSEDLFLPKPWTFATNIPEVYDGFHGMFCPGLGPNHQHDSTSGINTRYTQGYAPEMVDLLYACLKKHMEGCNSWWNGWLDEDARPRKHPGTIGG